MEPTERKEQNILVSVCCLAYNHVETVERTLKSVLEQKTDFRYEILIHDDASTDGTADIIRRYAERYPDRIRPILQKENQYSKGRVIFTDFILPQVRGKYVAVCECDDFWRDPEKLQRQADALESHPDCSICVHGTTTVDREGNPANLVFPPVPLPEGVLKAEDYLKMELEKGRWTFQLSSAMIHASTMENFYRMKRGGFAEKFYHVGDLPMMLYCCTLGDFYYIDRVMSTYTVDSGGFMSRLERDPEFARRVYLGYVKGFREFDEFSDRRFHRYIMKGALRKQFAADELDLKYDKIVHSPGYRFILRDRSPVQRFAYRVFARFPAVARQYQKIKYKRRAARLKQMRGDHS